MNQPFDRVFNFSAGPCTLPVEVLEEAKEGLLNYKGTGMSVMEMSHRSKPFESILAEAEADLRHLLSVPENYKILFLQGGASLQFSMIPLSFLGDGQSADYIVTGAWGEKAYEAATLVGKVNLAFEGKATNYNDVGRFEDLHLTNDAAYVHFTSNETIHGVQYHSDPAGINNLICDMSSDIISRPVDISKYALIYAGAQKNMGPAGATVVIVRDDLFERIPAKMHPILDFRLHSKNGSMYNTPPCWTIYMCGLVYKHALKHGGITGAAARNLYKAKLVYQAIDAASTFYSGHAQHRARSTMNVTFTLPNEELTKLFLKEADENKLDGLKGHRSVGGIRASIYNAFPLEGCQALVKHMWEFATKHG